MRFYLFSLAFLFVFAACSDDEDAALAPYVTTLAELQTDAKGQPYLFIPDGGTARIVTSTHKALTPDSLYRVQAMALYDDGGDKAVLRQIARVLSPFPREIPEERRKYAPADVLALWSSKRYVNMRVALHTAAKPHAFAFVEEGWDYLENDVRRLRLHLYHDRGENPEYYTREAYLSCPIYHYGNPARPAEKTLREGCDSIVFTITSYQGDRTIRVLYGD